ncbi:MAG: response regulator [Magnetococcales bacterium]|nr:response regulator [Magnetococcales bacterium]
MLRILLVDDQRLTEQLVQHMLTGDAATEFSLDYVQDPLLAEACIQQILPDVILLDYAMPDMDGFELLQRLRHTPSLQHVPVVMLSANEDAVQKAAAFALGANDYLVKLPEKVELLARLRYYGNAHRAHQRQQAAERALLEREAHLQAILDNALDAIITMDREGRIVAVNPAATQLLGYSREAMLGQPMNRFVFSEPFWQLYSQIMADCALGGALGRTLSKKWEVDGLRENGQQIDLEMAIIATHSFGQGGSASPTHCTAFFQDVTDQKQLLKSLEETLSVAEVANRVKSNFLSTMSHEIRTPMNAVIGLTELALQAEISPKVHDYLSKIQDASHALLRIINDILDFSKMDAGRLKLESVHFCIVDVLERVEGLLLKQAEEKGVQWSLEVASNCKGAVLGDPFRLEQVLSNLVSNAIKFTEQGGVVCRVRRLESPPKARVLPGEEAALWFEFSVQDTGIGLTEQQQEALFNPFMQADSSTSRRYGGTGLGLSICKRIIDAMDGTVRVESELGKGSLFSFAVPLLKGKGEAVDDPPKDGVHPGSGWSGESVEPLLEVEPSAPQADAKDYRVLRGARILLVEDIPINQQVARELLEKVGIQVDVAQDGVAAVDMAAACDYDAILMDIQMPGMDGYEATRRIRQHPSWTERPIIAMTAHALFDDQEHCLAVGMNDHIGKPIDKKNLYKVLLRWVRVVEGERQRNALPLPIETEERIALIPEQLPGIDVVDGLNRTGGNHRLYRSLLQEFVQDFAAIPQQVRQLLEGKRRDDITLAGQRVHAMRGVAGNLAAHGLFQAAQLLEQAIRVEKRSDWPALLDTLEHAMQQVETSIRTLPLLATPVEERAGEAAGPMDRVMITPLLSQLAKLIDEGNIEVFSCVEQLKPRLRGGGVEHEMKQMDACLEQFNFEGAWEFLTAIAQRLEISLECDV